MIYPTLRSIIWGRLHTALFLVQRCIAPASSVLMIGAETDSRLYSITLILDHIRYYISLQHLLFFGTSGKPLTVSQKNQFEFQPATII